MSEILYEEWEPVIGLEVHVQLNTQSKLFSCAYNRFGDEPNTNIGHVCTAQPGSLPVLNQEVIKKAVQFALAIKARINLVSYFDRKSYFYPDSPRNFQITQFEKPIMEGGAIIADVQGKTKIFPIHHAHIEDDAGMLKHFTNFAGVDFNRAGVALLEIVSEPCMHAPKEAVAYASALKALMEYLDASDCNMEEGSLRIDANISVRRKTETSLRNKVEIKNMNSFHNMEMAIESEIRRQIQLYSLHPHEDPKKLLTSGTYRFDLEKKETVLMRSKENAEDYRYCPEPDLPPIILSNDYIDNVMKQLPELPHDKFKRYVDELKLSEEAASVLINDKRSCFYFEEGLKYTTNAKALCNWITVEFAGRIKDSGKVLDETGITAKNVAELIELIDKGVITGKIAKSVADIMVITPEISPSAIVESNPDFRTLSDQSAIEHLVDQVLSTNMQSIADYKAGKARAFDFLVGQVMKLCKGQASPSVVNEILTKKLQ